MQHLLEKLGYHYCGKVPIDGVRLAYQKIKRKAETSLFQVVSERGPLGPKSRSGLQWLSILNNSMRALGLLSIIVSEEGLVELGFYGFERRCAWFFGALEQVHPYHEKVKEMVGPLFCWGSNRDQLSTSTARNSLPRAGVAVIERSHMVRLRPMANWPRIFLVVQPRPWDKLLGAIPWQSLFPVTAWWEKWRIDRLCVWTRSQTLALTTRRNYLEGEMKSMYTFIEYPKCLDLSKG